MSPALAPAPDPQRLLLDPASRLELILPEHAVAVAVVSGALRLEVGGAVTELRGPCLVGPLPPSPLTVVAEGATQALLIPLNLAPEGLPEATALPLGAEALPAARRAVGRWGDGDHVPLGILTRADLAGTHRWMARAEITYLVMAGQLALHLDPTAPGGWMGPGEWQRVAPRQDHVAEGSPGAVVLVTSQSGSLAGLMHHIPPEPWASVASLADLGEAAAMIVDGAGAILRANDTARRYFVGDAGEEGAWLIPQLTEASRPWLIEILAGGAPGRPALGSVEALGGHRPARWEALALPWSGLGDEARFLIQLRPRGEDPAEAAAARHRAILVEAVEPLAFALKRLAPGRQWVALWGEAGSGRRLFARALHEASPWATGPLLTLDASELSPKELRDHLVVGRPGHLGQTLGALAGQTLIVEGLTERSATERADLLSLLSLLASRHDAGRCRLVVLLERRPQRGLEASRTEDGLAVRGPLAVVHAPPLDAIPEAVATITERLLSRAAERRDLPPARLSPPAVDALRAEAWPRTLTDLMAFADHAAITRAGKTLDAEDVLAILSQLRPQQGQGGADDLPTLFEAEGRVIRRTLEHTAGNKALAARLLGITRTRLYRKIAEHQLDAFL